MITFNIWDLLVLIIGIILIWKWMSDDYKEDIGTLIGWAIETVWVIIWILIFVVFHYHVTIN